MTTLGMKRLMSNEPTRNEEAMKTMKFLGMAILAVVGAVIAGCSSDDSFTETTPQQPANTDNIVTLTTTVGFDDSETVAAPTSRALAPDGTKTFAVGDKLAVVYTNTSNATVKVESVALKDGDIANGGKSANFTVTLTNPKANGSVKYIYPAAMVKSDGSVNYDALATQDGTLSTLSSSLDLATYDGTLTASAGLPASTTLTNQLAILALTLKNIDGTSDLTASTTFASISDGTNSYGITRTAAAGPIYVAIRPTSSANIFVTAIAGTKYYVKSLSGKTYAASNGYPLSWKMTLAGAYSVASDRQVYFAPGNLQLVGENIWKFADNQWEFFGTSQSNNHRDLFGWGSVDNPNNISENDGDYSWHEWGNNDHVKAGIGTGWYTLSKDEWDHVFLRRTSNSTVFGTTNARYTKATIRTDVNGGIVGMIMIPDGVNIESSEVTTAGTVNIYNSSWDTSCTSAEWTALAAKGCVFLPATGCRYGNSVQQVGEYGRYWSSTVGTENETTKYAYTMLFVSGNMYLFDYYRHRGDAVRLARPAE